jgi:hypothetical protein
MRVNAKPKLKRHCKVCGKVLTIHQKKFCSKKHWIEFENSCHAKSKIGILKPRKNFVQYETENSGVHYIRWDGIYSTKQVGRMKNEQE